MIYTMKLSYDQYRKIANDETFNKGIMNQESIDWMNENIGKHTEKWYFYPPESEMWFNDENDLMAFKLWI